MDFPWRPRSGEIDDVLVADAEAIIDPAARLRRELASPSWPEPLTVECVLVEGRLLWGFTLHVLDLVLPRALAGEWGL